jgi:hypothetical protein
MVGDSVVLIDLRVQSLLKGQLPNVASVSVELSAVTPSPMFLCHHQSCCPIGSTAYEISSSEFLIFSSSGSLIFSSFRKTVLISPYLIYHLFLQAHI